MSKGARQIYIVEADDCAAEPFVSLKQAMAYGEELFAKQETHVTVTEFRGVDEEKALRQKRSWERRSPEGAEHSTRCWYEEQRGMGLGFWVCPPGCRKLPNAATWVLTVE